jgi:hypothetical protein
MVQALVAQRANEPFDECLAIGRTPRSAHDIDSLFGQGLVKAAWKLPVPIVLDESYSEASFTGALHEFVGLGSHLPASISQRTAKSNPGFPINTITKPLL